MVASSPARAQSLAPKELEALEGWYRRTADRTGNGEWGVAVGTMGPDRSAPLSGTLLGAAGARIQRR